MLTPAASASGVLVDSDWTEDERRAHERYAAQSYLRVIDASAGAVLGEIEDISLGGFRLQSGQPFRRDALLEFVIEVCVDGQGREPIRGSARSVWVRASEAPGAWLAGFAFVELAPQSNERLQRFIAELSA